eukprot:TRINITY_DN29487_c0_g1_i1.p1 TRINITY_DN29487_c0_g1~~TRINITY_DN29487_c0_g1_i1.p1  ORF type:complete len:126 (-),score=12.88 TRINITY_DN29487_c0_g1_i1:92-427(-)
MRIATEQPVKTANNGSSKASSVISAFTAAGRSGRRRRRGGRRLAASVHATFDSRLNAGTLLPRLLNGRSLLGRKEVANRQLILLVVHHGDEVQQARKHEHGSTTTSRLCTR